MTKDKLELDTSNCDMSEYVNDALNSSWVNKTKCSINFDMTKANCTISNFDVSQLFFTYSCWEYDKVFFNKLSRNSFSILVTLFDIIIMIIIIAGFWISKEKGNPWIFLNTFQHQRLLFTSEKFD